MKRPPPFHEQQRLQALCGYAILDTPAEQDFDDLTALAAEICETPTAVISLVDEDRLWFKSKVGITLDEMTREQSFCAHVLTVGELLVVPDTLIDPRFETNALVRGGPQIRFYAGAPLITEAGEILGTLCVIDQVPRQLNEKQLNTLRVLSRQVMSQMQLRRQVKELRRTEERLQLLEGCVANLNDMVLVTEAEPIDEPGLRIVYVNDAFVRRTGYTREEVVGKSPRFLQGPKTQRPALDRIRAALQNSKPVREELINYTKSGEEFWLEIDIVPVANAAGVITYLVAIERDITERKQMELSDQISHQQYERQHSALVALTHGALSLPGGEGADLNEITETVAKALYTQRVSLWLFNSERTAIVCKDLFESDPGRHTEGQELKASAYPAYFGALAESDLIAASDALRDVRTAEFTSTYLEPLGITSMLDAPIFVSGKLAGVLCVEHVGPPRLWSHSEQSFAVSVANFVSLILSQRAQAGSELRLRSILESEPECVKIVSVEGLLLDMNPAGLRMIEADDVAQVLGCPVSGLVHRDDQQFFVELHQRVCQGATGQLEFRMFGLHGTERWMETHSTPLREADGNITSVLSVTRDITERKLAEMRLARLNRLYQMLSRTNETIVRVREQTPLFEAVCRIAVEHGLFLSAAIVSVEQSSGRVLPLAHAGVGADYFSDISVVMTDPALNQGTLGTAVRTGNHDVCNDFANDPRMTAWKDAAQQRGYLSTAAFPIKADARLVGILVLFASEVDYFKADEVQLLAAVAEDLSFAIESLNKEEKRLTAERALRASEASMAAAQRIAHFGSWEVVMIEMDGVEVRRLTWSDEVYRIAGYEPGSVEPSNQLFYQLAHPDDHEAIQVALAEAIRERKQYSTIHRLIRPNGEERVVHETAQIFFDENSGRPIKMVGTVHDITEQRRSEEALRASEERFRSFMTHSPVAGWTVNDEGRFCYVSPGYYRMFGVKGDLVGKLISEIYEPALSNAYLANNRRVLQSGTAVESVEAGIRPDGSLGDFLVVKFPIEVNGGDSLLGGIALDITERQKMELQFLRAQRMESIGTLAGGIAHDLNNVLAPIMMAIELLKLEEKNPMHLGVLNTIEISAKRGADMVKQVLSFARGVEGQRMEVHLAPLIKEIVKITNETFLKNIQVSGEVPENLWTVQGDLTQLHQVLLNLCVNARDAMPDGGTLTLSACNVQLNEQFARLNLDAKVGAYVVLQVEDTGCGMTQEVINRIFDPFYTTKELGKGTGLGLSTTQAIIKSHGGFVRVHSEVGVGTRFRVYLPAQMISEPEIAGLVSSELPRGNGELVLFVDDEEAVREVTQQTLESFGYRVLPASDGAEAAALFERHQNEIAVVITDMMMPGMDGAALILMLQQMNPKVRIIAASGLSINGLAANASGACIRHFVPKPYTAETLLTLLRRVINEETPTSAAKPPIQ